MNLATKEAFILVAKALQEIEDGTELRNSCLDVRKAIGKKLDPIELSILYDVFAGLGHRIVHETEFKRMTEYYRAELATYSGFDKFGLKLFLVKMLEKIRYYDRLL